jgi:hypothetical protein
MPTEEQTHHTFLVRLWREKDDGNFVWRGSMTDVQSGAKKYFQSIPALAELIARAVGARSKEEGGALQKTDNDQTS